MEDFSKYLLKASTPDADASSSRMFDVDEHIMNTPRSGVSKVVDNDNVFSPAEATSSFSIEDNIVDLEWNIDGLLAQIEESGVKYVLLSKYFKKNSLFLKKIDAMANKLNEIYDEKKSILNANKPTYYSRDLRFQDGKGGAESACIRDVREGCETIATTFSKQFEYGDDKREDDVVLRQQIWSAVEDVMLKYKPSEIFDALSRNIKQGTQRVDELCSNIDLKRDAENLKLKFETGRLKDLSSNPAVLKTIDELIENGQCDHFQQFLMCEDSKNKTHSMKKKLKMLNTEIDSMLQRKLTPKLAQVMRQYFSHEQEHSSVKASLMHLRNEIASLQEEEKEKEETKRAIEEKYNRIQNFDKTVQKKQMMIQKLVQINGSAKSRHRQQQNDIATLVEEKILKTKKSISELYKKYQELVEEEVGIFAKVPLQNIESLKAVSSGENILASELSLNYLTPQYHNPANDTLKHVMRKMDIPMYSAPETLLRKVQEDFLEKSFQNLKKTASSELKGKRVTEILSNLDGTVQKMNTLCKDQFQSLMPSAKNAEEKAGVIMSEVVKFQNAAQTWWQQPAQYVVPWVKVDDSNVEQYLEQFSMQGELLKQIQVGKNK